MSHCMSTMLPGVSFSELVVRHTFRSTPTRETHVKSVTKSQVRGEGSASASQHQALRIFNLRNRVPRSGPPLLDSPSPMVILMVYLVAFGPFRYPCAHAASLPCCIIASARRHRTVAETQACAAASRPRCASSVQYVHQQPHFFSSTWK